MKKIETFEQLLALPAGTKIYVICEGEVFAERFVSAYHKSGSPIAVIDTGSDIEKIYVQDFEREKYFLEITAHGAREVMRGQLQESIDELASKIERLDYPLYVHNDFHPLTFPADK